MSGDSGVAHVCVHPVLGSCREKKGVVQMVRTRLPCPPYVELVSLMHFFESKLNACKSHAGGDQFPCKHEVRR